MNKFLVHWLFVILSIALLSACTSGGSLPAEEEADPFFDPLPSGLPVFTEINEPYLNTSSDGESTSLFSYKTQEDAAGNAVDTEVFSTSSDIILALNTAKDATGSVEFTLVAKNDSVYLINHQSNEVRLLSHFVNRVCELIPTEIVFESEVTKTSGDKKRLLTVLHRELIYVMTAESSDSSGDSCLSDSKKRFYALPLDHQLDPSLDEDGEIDSLSLVTESKARAKLIFGWKQISINSAQEIMEYGYLGYDVEQQELSLFDQNKELILTQARTLQRFDQVPIAPETLSDKYIFHVQALENQQYIIQLGLDVFVVDGGDLLSKEFDEVDSVLTDKVMSVAPRVYNESSIYALPVTAKFDADDLILIDNSKIYRLAYQLQVQPSVPNIETEIVQQNTVNFYGREHLTKSGFSQFDLEFCEDDDFDCIAAHDVDAQTWQFLTRCEAQFGCSIPLNTADFCKTREENLQTPSIDPIICTPSDYTHIAELNQEENDAELLAHMQYVKDFVRHVEFILQKNRLFITAQMNEKDVFLAYDFNQDFSAPKPVREQVFFGERASLSGLDAYFSNDNLFMTALSKGDLRTNECYKDGKQVVCNLGELLENGGGNSCTGKDLVEKLCTDQFNEYESSAIFCTENQLIDLSCSDSILDQIDDLFVESAEEDAKWFPVYDYTKGIQEIYLLTGDNKLALDTKNIGEGKLYLPTAFSVDQDTGQKQDQLVEIASSVELVVGGVRYKEPTLYEPGVFGRLSFITDEISQSDSQPGSLNSKLSTFILEQTFASSLSTEPDVVKAPKVAERLFERL